MEDDLLKMEKDSSKNAQEVYHENDRVGFISSEFDNSEGTREC